MIIHCLYYVLVRCMIYIGKCSCMEVLWRPPLITNLEYRDGFIQGAVKHGRGNALISADPCVMRLGNGASARFAKKARRKAKSWRPKEICTALNAPTLTKVRRC